ncbi:DUF7344 domain-containing protein [Halomarina rubra]|uniref:DUF7344 domain-containing protein n=1 Tax=Halomarina rubra TaxID=2071873 RepID=A0ABD6ASN5_9EURY|nr:hypothetical protein [Halomarina rubra]
MSYTDSETPPGEVARLLETDTRRQVVAFLLEVGGSWDVRTLADELVRLDPAVSPDSTDSEDAVEQRAITLYHCALPKLAAAEAVVFDRKEQTVTPGDRLEELGAYLGDEPDYSGLDTQSGGLSASS